MQLQVAKNLKNGMTALYPLRKVFVETEGDDNHITYQRLQDACAKLEDDIIIEDFAEWLQSSRYNRDCASCKSCTST